MVSHYYNQVNGPLKAILSVSIKCIGSHHFVYVQLYNHIDFCRGTPWLLPGSGDGKHARDVSFLDNYANTQWEVCVIVCVAFLKCDYFNPQCQTTDLIASLTVSLVSQLAYTRWLFLSRGG